MNNFIHTLGILTLLQLCVWLLVGLHKFTDIDLAKFTHHRVYQTYQYWFFWNTILSPIVFFLWGKGVI